MADEGHHPASTSLDDSAQRAMKNEYGHHSLPNADLPLYRPNRWEEHTRYLDQIVPERNLLKQINETNERDLSLYVYRAHMYKERRNKDVARKRKLELEKETEAQRNVTGSEVKPITESEEGLLDDLDPLTAWPLPPRRTKIPRQRTVRRSEPKAYIDPSGRLHNAKPVLADSTGGDTDGAEGDEDDDSNEYDESDENETNNEDDDNTDDACADQLQLPAFLPDGFENRHVYDPYVYKTKPDPRPSAQLEEALIAYLMKCGKERFRQRSRRSHNKFEGYTISADEEVMAAQLRPLARNMMGQFDNLLFGLHQRACVPTEDEEVDDEEDNESEEQDQEEEEDAEEEEDEKRDEGLHDWKTVLLIASLKNWPQDALKRAETRCKNIFERTPMQQEEEEDDEDEEERRTSTSQPLKTTTQHDETPSEGGHLQGEQARRVCEDLVCPYKSCPSSTKRFSHVGILIVHIRSNHPSLHVGFLCPVSWCPRSCEPFFQKRYLDQHIHRQHPLINTLSESKPVYDVDGKMACPIVGCRRNKRGFSRHWNLIEHLKRKHPEWCAQNM